MSRFYYGGQAVLEGVMMRGQRLATVAIRTPGGDIILHSEELPNALYRGRVARLPLVRGLVALWEMLVLGTRMMLYSANVQAGRSVDAEIPRSVVGVMLTVSLAFVILLFFVTPLLVSRSGLRFADGSMAGSAAEGLVRLGLFLSYLAVIGRLRNMRRVFQYHGAEHKTINAFEQGEDLSPSAVQRYSLTHVRCGTAFILWVLVTSIVVFALIGHPPFLIGIASRIILVPLIAALSYEILRLGARYYQVPIVRILLQPGLWLQRMTTREPTLEQISVAIAALKQVLQADGLVSAEPGPPSRARTHILSAGL